MRLIKNSSIKTRLYISFACMWAIMIFFAFYRGQQLNTVMERYNYAITIVNVKQQCIGGAITALNRIHFDNLLSIYLQECLYENIYILQVDTNEYINELRKHLHLYRDHVLSNPLLTESEKNEHIEMIDNIIYLFTYHYVPLVQDLIGILEQYDDEDMEEFLGIVLSAGTNLSDLLYELRSKTFAFSTRIIETMSYYDGADERMFNIATVVGITLAILLAVGLIKTVQLPITQLKHALKVVTSGDSDYPIRMVNRDDFGLLSHDIADMVDSIKETEHAARAKQEELLNELGKSLEREQVANRAKRIFLGNMSHEIRTPMNAIIGMTNIAKHTEDTAKKDYCLNKILLASDHLLSIINQILDMSKIEAGKLELSIKPFNFAKMIERVSSVMDIQINEKLLNLSVIIDKKIPYNIEGDELRISQVIINLMANAVKFTPREGSITIEAIANSKSKEEQSLLIKVSDTGIGITKEQQARVFSPFEQAEADTTHKFGGTGLGLAIAKRLVYMMGGEIWLESELGKGATFIFEIPIKMNNISKQDEVADLSQIEPNCFAGRTILLADDVEINREIVIAMLETTGLKINCAENGLQALKMFSETPEIYDMILMDIQMPEMDGLSAARNIRQLNTNKSQTIPIMAMTANAYQENISECLEAGMNDHIGKPLNFTQLMEKLQHYLSE